MKKHKLTIIRRQARALMEVCKDIQSLKYTRTYDGGFKVTFPRVDRFELQLGNGPLYRPRNVHRKIHGMSDYQKAAIFRELCRDDWDPFVREGFRPDGCFFVVKRFLCQLVFKKKMWYYTYTGDFADGTSTVYMCYVPDVCGVPTWDDHKHTMQEALAKYPVELYNWIKIPQ